MNKSDLIAIRKVQPGDEAFIMATWLKGLLYGYGEESLFQKIPKDIYFSNHHKVLERILTHPLTTVNIACLKEDPDVILGYCVYRQAGGQTVIDWAFVKRDWRNIGLAKSLFPKEVYAVSNLSKAGESILRKYPGIVFNPYV